MASLRTLQGENNNISSKEVFLQIVDEKCIQYQIPAVGHGY
jgi:hypothetical protein